MEPKIELFEELLYRLSDKYEVSTTRVSQILLDAGIHSVDDIDTWEELDQVVREGLIK